MDREEETTPIRVKVLAAVLTLAVVAASWALFGLLDVPAGQRAVLAFAALTAFVAVLPGDPGGDTLGDDLASLAIVLALIAAVRFTVVGQAPLVAAFAYCAAGLLVGILVRAARRHRRTATA